MNVPEMSKIVTFRLGEDFFAADIYSVERVLRYQSPTPIPNVPTWIEGVIEYLGRVVPVINLRRRFELPDLSVAAETRILVLESYDALNFGWGVTPDGRIVYHVQDSGDLELWLGEAIEREPAVPTDEAPIG